MDLEQTLEYAANAILEAGRLGILRGHLCWWENHICVRQRNHTAKRHVIFFQLTPEHFACGLTPDEWNELKKSLWNFFKEKI